MRTLQVTPGRDVFTSLFLQALTSFSGYTWSQYSTTPGVDVSFLMWQIGSLSSSAQLVNVEFNNMTVIRTTVTPQKTLLPGQSYQARLCSV